MRSIRTHRNDHLTCCTYASFAKQNMCRYYYLVRYKDSNETIVFMGINSNCYPWGCE